MALYSCSDNDEATYDGSNENQFRTASELVYVEPGQTNPHSLEVWLLKPAEQDFSIPVQLSKSTRAGSFFINGESHDVGDEFYVPVKKGELSGSVEITTSPSYYNEQHDTVQYTLTDPLFGRNGVAYLNATTLFTYQMYCPMAESDVAALAGTYNDLNSTLTFTVTAGIGDTIIIDGLAYALQYITGMDPIEGYPLKFVVDRTTKPIGVRVAFDQAFYQTTLDSETVTVNAFPTSQTGEINFCDKSMALVIPRHLSTEANSSAGSWIIEMKMQ